MGTFDIGDYCRRVEDHLTRVNQGHLVRIVGAGFELVRRWAEAGVPLSVVFRGIEMKADRHDRGASKRPLRIEFCEGDVQSLFDHWRRAVGLYADPDPGSADPGTKVPGLHEVGDPGLHEVDGHDDNAAEPKRKPLGKHLDRAIDRLSRASSRADLTDALRDVFDRTLQALTDVRATSARARGPAREEAIAALSALDKELSAGVRANVPPDWLESLREDAAHDLAPFRARLAGDVWQRSIDVTVDRLLRDRLGLPVLEL